MQQALRTYIPAVSFMAMIVAAIWTFGFAESHAAKTAGIYLTMALIGMVFGARMLAFAIEIGAWPFLRNLGVLIGLFVGLIGVYTFRHDMAWVADRMLRELNPSQPSIEEGGVIALVAGEDGHYRTRAMVNGVTITFMIDTGASSIVLSPHHAQQAGFDVSALDFTEETETANGIGRAAIIRLDELRVGHLWMQDLPARVNATHMTESLLGMEFLNRLNGWRVERGVLMLEP